MQRRDCPKLRAVVELLLAQGIVPLATGTVMMVGELLRTQGGYRQTRLFQDIGHKELMIARARFNGQGAGDSAQALQGRGQFLGDGFCTFCPISRLRARFTHSGSGAADGGNILLDLFGGLLYAFGQVSNLIGDDRKASPCSPARVASMAALRARRLV